MGGESLHVAGRLLGYRRASTTNRYVHLYDATLGEAVGRKLRVNLGDWVKRQLDGITRQNVEDRFNLITGKHGWSAANQTMSMLRSIYRRPFVDHESLRNPVEQWLAAGAASTPSGGGASRVRRRCCRAGIEAMGLEPAIHEVFLIGIYTGMRMGEILSLRWERVDLQKCILRVEETKTREPLELPVTRQLAAIFERRRAACGEEAAPPEGREREQERAETAAREKAAPSRDRDVGREAPRRKAPEPLAKTKVREMNLGL
ncbi:MAG: tyrosine-type recombinase/integrase [Rhodospirillaceae bacterium]|nr:tyrosine-type recombinase/integrase [Rhodospirillaceae bacterium]